MKLCLMQFSSCLKQKFQLVAEEDLIVIDRYPSTVGSVISYLESWAKNELLDLGSGMTCSVRNPFYRASFFTLMDVDI